MYNDTTPGGQDHGCPRLLYRAETPFWSLSSGWISYDREVKSFGLFERVLPTPEVCRGSIFTELEVASSWQ